MWVNHHVVLSYTREADRIFLFINLFLLMASRSSPFRRRCSPSTSEGRRSGGSARVRAHLRCHRRLLPALLAVRIPAAFPPRRRSARGPGINRSYLPGVPLYVIAATLVALVEPDGRAGGSPPPSRSSMSSASIWGDEEVVFRPGVRRASRGRRGRRPRPTAITAAMKMSDQTVSPVQSISAAEEVRAPIAAPLPKPSTMPKALSARAWGRARRVRVDGAPGAEVEEADEEERRDVDARRVGERESQRATPPSARKRASVGLRPSAPRARWPQRSRGTARAPISVRST